MLKFPDLTYLPIPITGVDELKQPHIFIMSSSMSSLPLNTRKDNRIYLKRIYSYEGHHWCPRGGILDGISSLIFNVGLEKNNKYSKKCLYISIPLFSYEIKLYQLDQLLAFFIYLEYRTFLIFKHQLFNIQIK